MDKWRIYRVLVPSVGGQGGGTITEILFKAVVIEREKVASEKGLADRIAARTDLEYRYMIPGLAQRNGSVYSTVSFVSPQELDLPESAFILSERFYTASADVMVAQELAEAVRFASEGLLKTDAVAIVNEHRFLTSVEKMPVTKDLVDAGDQISTIKKLAGTYVGLNAHELALANEMKPVYANTMLLGALCASRAVPISKESFLRAMAERFSRKALEDNVKAFEIGYDHVLSASKGESQSSASADIRQIIDRNCQRLSGSRGRRSAEMYMQYMDSITRLPPNLAGIFAEAVGQLVDFEGWDHARVYADSVMEILDLDRQKGDGSFRLVSSYAQHVAGRLMKWEGPFEVARIKSNKIYSPKPDTIVKVEALLQPNVEEIYGMVPVKLHNLVCRMIPWWPEYIEKHKQDGRPMSVNITGIGYLKLWLLWKLSFLHKHSVRYHRELAFVRHFTNTVKEIAEIDYELGCLVADYAQYIRGFSFVRARNIELFDILAHTVIKKCVEMDRALGNADYRIARSAFVAARNMVTLDGTGKDRVLRFMGELEDLFQKKKYGLLYAKLALRQLTPVA